MGFSLALNIFYIWLLLVDEQYEKITEYCYCNPNETTTGNFIINCSELLINNPELVKEYEQKLNETNAQQAHIQK